MSQILHSEALDDLSQILGSINSLFNQPEIGAAFIGTILGFFLSFAASTLQRGSDWKRTRKLKQQEALLDFMKVEREEFLEYRRAYADVLKGRSSAALMSNEVHMILQVKTDYLQRLDNLCATYAPILAGTKKENALTKISDMTKAALEELYDIYKQEHENVIQTGKTTSRMSQLAEFESGINKVVVEKNEFIRATAKHIGSAFK
jgi:hypothetical protein